MGWQRSSRSLSFVSSLCYFVGNSSGKNEMETFLCLKKLDLNLSLICSQKLLFSKLCPGV